MSNRGELKALSVVESLRAQMLATMTNQVAKEILDEPFVKAVLKIAWDYQFEEDRVLVRRKVRQLVSDAIESRSLGTK